MSRSKKYTKPTVVLHVGHHSARLLASVQHPHANSHKTTQIWSTHRIHPSVQPDQTLRAHQIPFPQQLGNIQVQRAVRLASGAEQLLNRFQRAHKPIRRRPRALQQIQTDLARLEVDVRVAEGRREVHRRRAVGVGRGHGDGEGPFTTYQRGI